MQHKSMNHVGLIPKHIATLNPFFWVIYRYHYFMPMNKSPHIESWHDIKDLVINIGAYLSGLFHKLCYVYT